MSDHISWLGLFHPSLMFAGKARSLPRGENMKGFLLWLVLVLIANIRLGWKGLPGTNTQAYLVHLEVKSKS